MLLRSLPLLSVLALLSSGCGTRIGGDEICVIPTPEEFDTPWELRIEDANSSGWSGILASGTGMLCGDADLDSGNRMKFQGWFHGDDEFWLFMIGETHAAELIINDQSVPFQSTYWGAGVDGEFTAP